MYQFCMWISRHKGRVQGKIMHEGQWFLSNPVGFRWVYDCSNIEIVEGVIPEGANLSRILEILLKIREDKT